MRKAMGRKLRKTQLRRYTKNERRREGWHNLQLEKMRESPSHWVWYWNVYRNGGDETPPPTMPLLNKIDKIIP